MMKRLCNFLFVAVSIIFASAMLLSGCDNNDGYQILTAGDNGEYRTIIIEKGIALFSFEYSARYSRIDGPAFYDDEIHQFTGVTVLAPMKQISVVAPNPDLKGQTVSMSYTPAFIDVFVYDASDRGATAISEFEEHLSHIEEDGTILDRSQVTVSGVLAEYVAYTSNTLIPLFAVSEGGIPAKYCWTVYFDHAGLIWNIEAESEVAMANQVKGDFEHVLQTFQIIE
jgi:hypothetical protein